MGNEKGLYEKGKLYTYDGADFVEVQKADDIVKLPVTEEAAEVVKAVRAHMAKAIGARPELSVVASAMLVAAADIDGLERVVRAYGVKLYQQPDDC